MECQYNMANFSVEYLHGFNIWCNKHVMVSLDGGLYVLDENPAL